MMSAHCTTYRETAEFLRNPGGPYFADDTPALRALETMVDTVGLRNVIWALEHIANEKADHLRANWQNKTSARTWEIDARLLGRLAVRLAPGES
jgi:hypothetical protein